MGIKGLNAFLKDTCPSAFINLPKSYFKGKRTAIDADNVFRKLMSRAHKEIVHKTDVCVKEPDRTEIINRWIHHVKNFIIDFLNKGNTPIFVIDGEYIPQKTKTQGKRRADRKKLVDEAEEYKNKVLELDELERTPAMVTELRKRMQNLSTLNKEERELMINIIAGIGIPVLQATGEGEKLCAMLCIEGRVDAVYSRDTDLVAFGCPLTINEEGGYVKNEATGNSEESFKCTYFKPILAALKMEYETFLDLCIMSGCDFNDNIYNVGIKKSYKELVKCKSIENLPAKLKDKIECLNHEKTREIFKYGPSEEFCQGEIRLDINTDLSEARDILNMYGAENWIKDIGAFYKNLAIPNNVIVSKRPSLSRSAVKLRLPPKVKPETNNNDNNNNITTDENIDNKADTTIIEKDETKLTTYINQKPSPNRITAKQVNNLSRNQLEKYNLRIKSTPASNIPENKPYESPVRLNIRRKN